MSLTQLEVERTSGGKSGISASEQLKNTKLLQCTTAKKCTNENKTELKQAGGVL